MRSLSILALSLALGSALNVEAERGHKHRRPCGGFDGCDLGDDVTVQEFLDDAAGETDATSITCQQLHKAWKSNCGTKVMHWDLTTQCMMADSDNDGMLDVDELTTIVEVEATWPDEVDEKCKCGRKFAEYANDDGVLEGDDLTSFASKKCWKNKEFDYATECGTESFDWAAAECLCEGLDTVAE